MFIPFQNQFKDAMLSGEKTATSRNRKYGEIGEVFHIFGTAFQLTNVSKMSLYDVAQWNYDREGLESPQEFVEIWEKIHPLKGFNQQQVVWFHEFKKL